MKTTALDRRAFLTAAAGVASGRPGGCPGARRRRFPRCRRRATGPTRRRRRTRIRTSWRSIRGSGATSSFNNVIKRLHIGTGWAEGPAWNGVGKYLVWSDIPANAQMRWIEDDGRVTTFRNPSGYSNGNTFDYEGRQISLRARQPPRGALRAERHRDRHRREVPGQAAEFAERRRGASRRQHLVHRSVLRHPRQLRRVQGGVGDEGGGVSRRPEDRRGGEGDRRSRSAERPLLLARLQEALRGRHRHGPRDQGVGRGRQVAAQRQAARAARSFPAPARRPPPTACAATRTATSGRARVRACW